MGLCVCVCVCVCARARMLVCDLNLHYVSVISRGVGAMEIVAIDMKVCIHSMIHVHVVLYSSSLLPDST